MTTERFYRQLASAVLSLFLASAGGLFVLLAFTSVLSAQTISDPTSNPVVAYAYVGEKTTPGEISAFAVHLNGMISRVSGSPFRGPAQNLVVSSRYVFATDQLNMTTYTRLANGALVLTSAVKAHNDTPSNALVGGMTLDRTGSSLYASEVIFRGGVSPDFATYSEFAVTSGGKLVFRSNAPALNDGSSLQFSQDNKFAYGENCFFMNWDILAFDRGASGQLTPFNPGNTFPPTLPQETPCPNQMTVSAKGYLAIAWGDIGSIAKQSIEVLRITPSGALQHVSNLRTNFAFISGMKFDPTGKYLAVAGPAGIESFRLNTNGTLTLLSAPILKSTRLFGLQWDSVGHVYAISSGALYVFRTQNGILALAGQPVSVTKPQSLAVLTANAVVANATLSTTSLGLQSEPVGTTSPAVSVQLSNHGTATLSITGITASGDFGETNTCGSTLAAGAQCSISVTSTPSATGTRFGTVLVTDNAPGSPQTISLTGFGLQGPVATLTGLCSGVAFDFRTRRIQCVIGQSFQCPVGQPAITPTLVSNCGLNLVDTARNCSFRTPTGLTGIGHCVAQ
jgi:hypothetical protein